MAFISPYYISLYVAPIVPLFSTSMPIAKPIFYLICENRIWTTRFIFFFCFECSQVGQNHGSSLGQRDSSAVQVTHPLLVLRDQPWQDEPSSQQQQQP